MSTILLVSAILIPLLGSVTTFIWGHKGKKTVSIVSSAFTAATFMAVVGLYVLFNQGQTLRAGLDIGLPFQLALRADAFSMFLSLLSTSIWFLVTVYSVEYINSNKGLFACFSLLSLYGMLGVTLSENLFTLLIFFETFSLASSVLILHDLSERAVKAAFQYFFISVVGTACLIVGTALLYGQAGSINLLGSGISHLTSSSLGFLSLWLLVVGFGVKAGMFPTHVVMPQAYPVSPSAAVALLSGVMTKVGTYGLIRVIYGVYGAKFLSGTSTSTILIVLSIITMLGGSIAAITQTEIKKMLAYSSIAQLGYVLLGTTLLSASALAGGILHILNHALMKSSLFLAVGAIGKKTGKTNLADLKGIGRKMPITMTVITLSAISMIGVPPFLGFFSKWLLATGAMEATQTGVIAPWAAYTIIGVIVLSGLLNVLYYGPIVINGWFGGKEPKPVKEPLMEPSWVMVSPMLILSAATLVLGIYVKYPLKLIGSIIKLYFRS